MHEEKDYHDIPLEIIENGRQKLEDCLLTCQAFRLAEYSLRCYLARDESFKLCHALVSLYPTSLYPTSQKETVQSIMNVYCRMIKKQTNLHQKKYGFKCTARILFIFLFSVYCIFYERGIEKTHRV